MIRLLASRTMGTTPSKSLPPGKRLKKGDVVTAPPASEAAQTSGLAPKAPTITVPRARKVRRFIRRILEAVTECEAPGGDPPRETGGRDVSRWPRCRRSVIPSSPARPPDVFSKPFLSALLETLKT